MTEQGKIGITVRPVEREKLCQAIKKAAWGYVLLHLNFNLGTINILPNWLGYIFILQALPAIGKEEPSVLLLTPLGKILTLWEGLLWFAAIFGVQGNGYPLEVIAAALSLYFHFQLLTNLAGVAEKYACPEQKRLLALRTVRTILITFLALPIPWQNYRIVSVMIALVGVIITVWICSILFSMKHYLEFCL